MTTKAWFTLLATGLLLLPITQARAQSAAPAPAAAEKASPDADGAAARLADTLSDPNRMMQSFVENGHDGDWVEYARYVDGKPNYATTLRMMLLKDADPTQPDWIEIWLDKTGAQSLRLRNLGDGRSEILFKMGKAIYAIEDETRANAGPMCLTGTCGSGGAAPPAGGTHRDHVQTVSVKTLAGSFDCKYVKKQTKQGPLEVWYSDGVPGLGLVRMKSFGEGGLELVAYGRAGKSSFPRKFKTNPFPLQKLGAIGPMLPGLDKALTSDLRKAEGLKEPAKDEPKACEPGKPGCEAPSAPKK